MKVPFEDLFEVNLEQETLSPKRTLRFGAMKLLPEQLMDLNDASLGQPLRSWIGKSFDIKEDGDFWTIIRIHLT